MVKKNSKVCKNEKTVVKNKECYHFHNGQGQWDMGFETELNIIPKICVTCTMEKGKWIFDPHLLRESEAVLSNSPFNKGKFQRENGETVWLQMDGQEVEEPNRRKQVSYDNK